MVFVLYLKDFKESIFFPSNRDFLTSAISSITKLKAAKFGWPVGIAFRYFLKNFSISSESNFRIFS